MKTKLFLAALMALALFSCSKEEAPVNSTKSITFKVDDLSVQKTPMTRAALSTENLTDIEIYDGTSLIKSQSSTDADFGAPTLELSYGEHTLYFLAHRSEGASYADGVWSATKVRGTFIKKVNIEVTTATDASQSVELDRKIYRLKFAIADAVPATAATAKVTVTDYYGSIRLSDYTGQGKASKTTEMNIATLQGKTDTDVSVYGFCPVDGTEYKTAVSIGFYDASGNLLQEHSREDIPLQTNYVTTIKGTYFQTTPTWSISVNAEWSGEKEIEL